uniref:Uncharacterized protein n=1 Tax=Candidatus Kentrum sp. FM TaxID=2126340 RepID=A0A450U3M8_9GAMM|nr:MAG: hypothetical protein BECKFM1743C_GA0114222_110271 [Candidatus Kentron sp. FM]
MGKNSFRINLLSVQRELLVIAGQIYVMSTVLYQIVMFEECQHRFRCLDQAIVP